MEFILENDVLKVTVTTWGAQVKSVVRKCDGVEHMWQADPSVWGYHAPILFPYTGRVKDGKIEAKGKVIDTPTQHGFARTMEHSLVSQEEGKLVLALRDTPQTLAAWPWKFCLKSTFTLEGDTLRHSLTVENLDEEKMHFGIGYHPAFTVPFDAAHKATDYRLEFSHMESPLCLGTYPKGLINGSCYYLGNNIRTLDIDDQLFANDSHCMVNLVSDSIGLYENGSGRGVVCSLEGFPYCLIWSKPGMPHFVCIEPWNSLPSPEAGGIAWEEKPAAACVAPGDSWTTTLKTSFVR